MRSTLLVAFAAALAPAAAFMPAGAALRPAGAARAVPRVSVPRRASPCAPIATEFSKEGRTRMRPLKAVRARRRARAPTRILP